MKLKYSNSNKTPQRYPISHPYGQATEYLFEYFGQNWSYYNETAMYLPAQHDQILPFQVSPQLQALETGGWQIPSPPEI